VQLLAGSREEECIKEIIALCCTVSKCRHIEENCGRKQRHMSPAERDHMWMGAVKKDIMMLLIFYIISIAHATGKGGIVSPGHCFNS